MDIGENTQVVPIYAGNCMHQQLKQLPVGGKMMTGYLIQMVKRKGIDIRTEEQKDAVRDMKEKLCYVAGGVKVSSDQLPSSFSTFFPM